MTRSSWALLFGILLVGAGLRFFANDVTTFSRADETVYLNYAKQLSSEGVGVYPKLVNDYVRNEGHWISPPPLRFGYLGAIGLSCKLGSECSHRTLAWVSTLAGVMALVATFLFARELFDVPVALAATALSVTSPLQLALGRRALSDELFCAAILFASWALVRAVRAPAALATRRTVVAVALMAFALAVKETAVLVLPALLTVVFVLRGGRLDRRDIVFVAGPPLVAYLIFTALAEDATAAFEILRAVQRGIDKNPYVEPYSSGAPHRILVDLLLIEPVSCLVAAFGAAVAISEWSGQRQGAKSLLLLLGIGLVLNAFSPAKNLRYVIHLDAFIRILSAWVVVARVVPAFRAGKAVALSLALVLGASDLLIFRRIFLIRGVYDPVTVELTHALDMTP